MLCIERICYIIWERQRRRSLRLDVWATGICSDKTGKFVSIQNGYIGGTAIAKISIKSETF